MYNCVLFIRLVGFWTWKHIFKCFQKLCITYIGSKFQQKTKIRPTHSDLHHGLDCMRGPTTVRPVTSKLCSSGHQGTFGTQVRMWSSKSNFPQAHSYLAAQAFCIGCWPGERPAPSQSQTFLGKQAFPLVNLSWLVSCLFTLFTLTLTSTFISIC